MKYSQQDNRCDLWLEHQEGVLWNCPHCDRQLSCHDHTAKQLWRNVDWGEMKTYVRARIPKVTCPEHDVLQVEVPWSSANSRVTGRLSF